MTPHMARVTRKAQVDQAIFHKFAMVVIAIAVGIALFADDLQATANAEAAKQPPEPVQKHGDGPEVRGLLLTSGRPTRVPVRGEGFALEDEGDAPITEGEFAPDAPEFRVTHAVGGTAGRIRPLPPVGTPQEAEAMRESKDDPRQGTAKAKKPPLTEEELARLLEESRLRAGAPEGGD